jgi:2-(1,2-epoxy-1,2-dihydrophenyl)acetyl-CoA isomerase
MTESINLNVEGAVARITLNRPQAGNSIDQEVADKLLSIAHWCEAEKSVRAILLTGAGRMFCAGGDVQAFSKASAVLPSFVRGLTASLHMAICRLAAMPKPVITAVNGPAAGAGLGLAILGDIVLAAKSASFVLAYPSIGLSPDAGATFLLPRLIGLRKTQEMLFLGRSVDAEEAAKIGLVTKVVDDAALIDEAEAIAVRLSAMATRALGRSKALLLKSSECAVESQLEEEARSIALCADEADSREGVKAFLEKRKPNFCGVTADQK